MSIFEYLYNVISIIFIVDFLWCVYQIGKNAAVVSLVGITSGTKIKIKLEIFVIIVYFAYLVYKLFNFIF